MKSQHYLVAIVAGFFIGNTISHLAAGVMGQMFPSPFSVPPTIGLSSPLINTGWGLFNMVLAYACIRASKASFSHARSMLAMFVGFAGVTLYSSIHFGAVFGNPSL